jgi:BirA family biotin operon repressor/biotin-[acetyl-CoA-carboxylase] ligase
VARPFDARRFSELRAELGLGWGEPLVHHGETESTNDLALAAARGGAANGSLFVADYQSKGRGRRGKSWSASAGDNLLFSILVRPPSSAPIGAVTLAVGLGVRAALQPYSHEHLGVKWPNDVLAGSRKLAGILCEGQLRGSHFEALVIGVGINVAEREFPPELEAAAVSLAALGVQAPQAVASAPFQARPGSAALPALPERERLLAGVLASVEARVEVCLSSGFEDLLPEFSRHDALSGARVSVSGSPPIEGVARGVDPDGHLLVETDGVVIPVHSGTVRVI